MRVPRKYLFFLLLLNIILAPAGYIIFIIAEINFRYDSVLLLQGGFSVISLIAMLIFLKGQKKDPQGKVLYTLVSMGLKFLLELILALIWFVVAKKNSTTSVLIFFVLYLTLTLFSLICIMKALKNKPL
ncbi:MAG TPA: hypothetical protein VHO46_02635 [Bacteroidales bacterium]|nr:hypothetical protein [Bacteroidales bacterium]